MIGIFLTVKNHLHDYTIPCIKSLFQNTRCPFSFIVADNGSNDGTGDYLRGMGIELIGSMHPTDYSKILNMGLRYFMESGHYRYICAIHNDMLFFDDGWLERLADFMERHRDVGKLSPENIPSMEKAFRYKEQIGLLTSEWRDDFRPGNQSPWILRREVVERVGLFDEGYLLCGGYEDWDYNNRILRTGYKVGITRYSHVVHFAMGTRKYDSREEAEKASLYNRSLYCQRWGTTEPRV